MKMPLDQFTSMQSLLGILSVKIESASVRRPPSDDVLIQGVADLVAFHKVVPARADSMRIEAFSRQNSAVEDSSNLGTSHPHASWWRSQGGQPARGSSGETQGVCGCDRFKTGSIQGVLRTIVKKDGYRRLMKGWVLMMLFHAPAAALCWSTYEAGKSFFQDINESRSQNNVA